MKAISTLALRVPICYHVTMITDRQQKLLQRVIRDFVQTAQPVSSKSLEESGFLGVSSATIRSEMSELERLGYLEQRHTSAGRIPTDKAYRFFVDNVVQKESLEITDREKRKIDETIQDVPREPREINKSIAQVLSELTDQLVITNVIDEDLPAQAGDFYKVGLKNLFEFPEFQELDRIFRLTSFFEEFEHELHRFHDVQVFIGHESPFRNISDESVICAEYRLPHNFTGSVIMVGPTRMNYRRNMGLVKYTTDELNQIYG